MNFKRCECEIRNDEKICQRCECEYGTTKKCVKDVSANTERLKDYVRVVTIAVAIKVLYVNISTSRRTLIWSHEKFS